MQNKSTLFRCFNYNHVKPKNTLSQFMQANFGVKHILCPEYLQSQHSCVRLKDKSRSGTNNVTKERIGTVCCNPLFFKLFFMLRS